MVTRAECLRIVAEWDRANELGDPDSVNARRGELLEILLLGGDPPGSDPLTAEERTRIGLPS